MAGATRNATLRLSLIDGVSKSSALIVGALNRVNGAVNRLAGASMAPAHAMTRFGKGFRAASYNLAGVSAPITLGAAAAGKAVYEYEKAGNRMQAFGLLTEKQRENLERLSQSLNKEFPYTNKDILRAAQELFRAGMTYDQVVGMLRDTLNLGLAGDIDVKAASDYATNIMTAMKMPMETTEQAQESIQKVVDALAYAATKSNTDVKLMADTFRYVAPLAAAAGMSLEEVTAVSMELAKAGIKGSEAGVALRSALVRLAKPTKPMLAAFERLKINIQDFIQYRDDLSSTDVIGSLRADGFELEGMEDRIDAILNDDVLKGAPARMIAALTDEIVAATGDEANREALSQAITDIVLSGAQKVDFYGLMKTLREKGATITDIAQIFDVRMGSRLASILYNDLDDAVGTLKEEYRGTGAKMVMAMIQGIVGSTARLVAALENLSIKIAESGVLDTVARTFESIGESANSLAKTNPRLLEFGAYALIGAAALAPFGLAVSGAATALGFLVNPITMAIGGLAYFATTNWREITAGFKAFGRAIRTNMGPETTRIFEAVKKSLTDLFKPLDSNEQTDRLFRFARAGRLMGESLMRGLEQAAQAWRTFSQTAFATGFTEGMTVGFERVANAAKMIADAMGDFGVNAQPLLDFLNSDAGEKLGKFAGEFFAYGLTFAGAALLFGLVSGPVRAVGSALLYLSGVKLAFGVLRFLGRLVKLSGSAKAVSGLAAAVSSLALGMGDLADGGKKKTTGGRGGKRGKGGGARAALEGAEAVAGGMTKEPGGKRLPRGRGPWKMGGLGGIGAMGAGLGFAMYGLHEATKDDPNFGVWYLNTDGIFNGEHDDLLFSGRGIQAPPRRRAEEESMRALRSDPNGIIDAIESGMQSRDPRVSKPHPFMREVYAAFDKVAKALAGVTKPPLEPTHRDAERESMSKLPEGQEAAQETIDSNKPPFSSRNMLRKHLFALSRAEYDPIIKEAISDWFSRLWAWQKESMFEAEAELRAWNWQDAGPTARRGPRKGGDKWEREREDSQDAWLDGPGDWQAQRARVQAQQAQTELDSITASWPARAQAGMQAFITALSSGGDQAKQQAAMIGQGIEQELDVTGHPDVDTSRLERALSLARQVAAAVKNIGSASPSAGASVPVDGKRARGGPVRKGLTYLVGEQGEELFSPTENGMIYPNHALRGGGGGAGGGVSNTNVSQRGGDTTFNNSFNIYGVSPEQVSQKLARDLELQLLRSRQTSMDGRPTYEFG